MVRIYISSTYNDLKDYRKVVYCALRQLGHDVIAMEDYVATDERPLDKCLDDVASCEVYVGIFAWRYGYIPEKNNPDKQSITEREFRHAMAENRSRLLFLVNENYPWSPMLIEKGDGASRLEALKAELRTDYTVSFFTTPDNLAQLVNSAVSLWEKKQDGQRKIGGTLTIPNYDFPTNYLPRKILSARQYSSVQRFLQQELSEDLVAVTKKERCVALLGNPGIGKTTELQRLAAVVIREDPRLYPHLIPLNKYVNQSFEQLLPVGWDKIPEDRYLLILDGFDEIESKNKNDAIRHIEFFLEQHPKARALISCRTNFYRTATQRFPGTLSGFVAYLLLDLDHTAVQNYIEDRLANRTWAFYEAITRSQTHELLRIPFFLVRLVDLFETRHSLPPSRAEIFEQMITERMKGDFVHYRTTFDLTERQKDILAILERIALGTEILGRNYLSDDEYRSLVPEGLRDLGAYCSLLVKEFGHESVTWRFEHNNFQEYFAARVLSRQSLETIKRFVSFETGSMRVIPSWVNTLSFLVNISSDPRLHRWILDEIPDLAVKFEPDRIDPATRERLFKAIFLGYKTKQIPIDRDKFNYLELARFGQSAQTVDFLLEEATAATHHAILQCAIELLGLMDVSHEAIARVRDFLIVVAIDNHRGPVVQNAALCALGNLAGC